MDDEPRRERSEKVARDGSPGSAKPSKLRLLARLRNHFLTGIIVTAPISITFYISWLFISYVDGKVRPLIPTAYLPETYLPFSVPGIGLFVVVIGLTAIGALTAGIFGRSIVRFGERMLNRMPVIRSIYSALKQVFETVFARKSQAFRQVVLIEYPRTGSWAMGFATGTTKGEVQHVIEDEVVNVFLPTTPNPTSGYLLFLPKRDVVFLAMSVEDGIKMIISGGVITPPDKRPKKERERPKIPCQPERPTVVAGGGPR